MRLSTTTTILSAADSVPPEGSVFKAMELCREAGFRHLDMNFGTQGKEGYPLATDGWRSWVEEVQRRAQQLHVTFYQAHSFFYRTRESTSLTIDRPWYEERFRRSIIAAQMLGVRWLVMHPADFYADETYDFEKARRYNIEYWSPFVELALRHNVGFAFENMFQSGRHARYCSQVDELIDLVDAFNDPRVGVCWDTGHAFVARQNQPEAIRKLGKRLKATHIHDNHGQPKGDEHLMPYYGLLNWEEILRALGEIGYENNFSFELKHATQALPPRLCLNMLRFMHSLGGEMVEYAQACAGERVAG